ncbi:HNH endonuclease [Shewanella sp. 0m-4]
MWSVTFRSDRRRTASYKTEKGALKAIWKWLKVNDGHAVFLAPGSEPKIFNDCDELPFSEPIEQDFYSSGEWHTLRHEALMKYGSRCSCCGITPDQGAIMHVDHIKPRSQYPELALDIENLQILCAACNKGKSNLSEKKWR